MKSTTIMRHTASVLLLAVLLLLAFGSSDSGSSSETRKTSNSSVSSGEEKRIAGDKWIGCTDRSYFDKLLEYASQKDHEAFKKAFRNGVFDGTCTMFKNGEMVYITDTAIFSGLVKVRRKGEVLEYWTNLEAVK